MWLNWKILIASAIAITALYGTNGKIENRSGPPRAQDAVSTISSPEVVLSDDLHWYVIRGPSITKVQKSTLELVRSASVTYEESLVRPRRFPEATFAVKTVSMRADNEDVGELLGRFFKMVGAKFTIDPELRGTVTFSLVNVPSNQILPLILKQVQGAYRVENDVFHFESWKSPFAELTMCWLVNPPPIYKLEGEWIVIFVGPFVINFSTERMRSEGVYRISKS